MADYLLDSNCLINLLEGGFPSELSHDLEKKLAQEDNCFFLTPLIRYEVLRGINWKNNNKLKDLADSLEKFTSLDITREIADLARDLYRFDRFESERDNVDKNLDKRKFDMFHFATAVVHNLQIFSLDEDINAIETLHKR